MIQTIYLNEEERPVSFAPVALIAFEKDSKINFLSGDSISQLNMQALGKLAYYGLKYGAKINGDKFDFTQEEVLMWFPTLDSLTKVIELFTEAMPEETENEKKENQVIG